MEVQDPGATKVLIGLWRFWRRLVEALAPCLEEEWGLSAKDVFLLHLAGRQGPTGLSRSLLLPAPTVSHHLRRLEALGLLERSLEPKDLRRFHLRLTPRGEEALRQALACLEAALEASLAQLSPEERQVFFRVLKVLGGGETCED